MSTDSKTPAARPSLRWSVADITVAAVIAVASGVIFWGAGIVTQPLEAVFTFLPGSDALLWGLYYFAGPLAAIIVRKPGAALFAEVIAALVEALLGSHWGGLGTLIPGLVQGLAAEIVFLIFAYKAWNLAVTVLSGAAAGFAGMAVSWVMYYLSYDAFFIVTAFVCSTISGIIFAGVIAWFLYQALAKTGALDRVAGGRDAAALV
ncbi:MULTISPECIES: ECF transporter S component [Bifidobacterium]|uniref:ECF transporter S component n=1 Tax=Bifidobacterium TaxID=1678 RepID=UPI001BDC634A|nr:MULTISPECIES: ECF transporter S component [Bifidobacterium]MBT1160426.1 ECF transporter S component [Bifidobacterium sp. SO1]MBW3079573.1 ECF transporter S component [Bifidobacterium simiiventris]